MHQRHIEHGGIFKVTAQLDGVGRLAHQIELIEQGLAVLLDDLEGAQPIVRNEPSHEAGQCLQQTQIGVDHRADIGADDFQHHGFAAALETGGVHLGHRGRG